VLLNSILRRVRQRAFVMLNPCQIERVDKAAANLACSASLTRRLSARSPSTVPRGLGSSIGMVAVNLITFLKKARLERYCTDNTGHGAFNPECREALPYVLDASFETLKNPQHEAGGFFHRAGSPSRNRTSGKSTL
jgi:hypothetical protein